MTRTASKTIERNERAETSAAESGGVQILGRTPDGRIVIDQATFDHLTTPLEGVGMALFRAATANGRTVLNWYRTADGHFTRNFRQAAKEEWGGWLAYIGIGRFEGQEPEALLAEAERIASAKA